MKTGYPDESAVKNAIAELQVIMRLQDWDIEFAYTDKVGMERDKVDAESYGLGARNQLLRRAKILLNTECEDGAKEWYSTLVHEMVHILTTDYCALVHNLGDQLPKAVWNVMHEMVRVQYEIMVESIARAILNAEGRNLDGTTKSQESEV